LVEELLRNQVQFLMGSERFQGRKAAVLFFPARRYRERVLQGGRTRSGLFLEICCGLDALILLLIPRFLISDRMLGE